MKILKIVLLVLAIVIAFIGFAIGRVGHLYGGQLNVPHHWIYGLALMIVGIIWRKKGWGWYVFAFGLGLFVSDLKDFITLRFYSVDDVKVLKFWQID